MANHSANERRKHGRLRKTFPQTLRLLLEDHPGGPKTEIITKLVDTSEGGCCVDLSTALPVGSLAVVDGQIIRAPEPGLWSVRVSWCLFNSPANYSAGLRLEAPVPGTASGAKSTGCLGKPVVDYYDVLQLSTKADPETIHRVYRLLAQRYHPDNKESGGEEIFKGLLQAYEVLSDPEKRAAYDVRHRSDERIRWRIFHQPEAAQGKEAERRKRHGILSVLYTRRLNEPAQPSMSIAELEDLLAVPREHLEFSLWFLKEKGWIIRADNTRYSVTVAGVEQAEASEATSAREDRLLTSAST